MRLLPSCSHPSYHHRLVNQPLEPTLCGRRAALSCLGSGRPAACRSLNPRWWRRSASIRCSAGRTLQGAQLPRPKTYGLEALDGNSTWSTACKDRDDERKQGFSQGNRPQPLLQLHHAHAPRPCSVAAPSQSQPLVPACRRSWPAAQGACGRGAGGVARQGGRWRCLPLPHRWWDSQVSEADMRPSHLPVSSASQWAPVRHCASASRWQRLRTAVW